MNKNEFLRILRENLNGLPADEAESAVRYYSEYIDDAGGSDAVFEELGDPAELAKKIRNDGQPKDGVEKEPASVAEKKSKMPIWAKILITVLTFPFWIGPVAAVFGITVAFVSVAAGFLLGGAAAFGSGIYFAFQDVASGLLCSGSGLLLVGLGGLIGVGMFYVCKYEGIGVYKLCRLIFTNGGKK